MAPLAGNVFGANSVTVGYFAQHQLDEQIGRASCRERV